MPTDPGYLRDLFNRSAGCYDALNVLTSMGQIVLWRRAVAALAAPRPTDRVLDAFSGTGGLALQVLPRLGPAGEIVLVDLSRGMLDIAQAQVDRRLARRPGPRPKVTLIAGDLLRQELGLGSGSFDVVTLGWGLRYVANVPAALERVRSFLRPGGRLVVLEFTRPRNSGCLSDWRHHPAIPAQLFFRYAVPRIGSWLAGDSEAYEYMRVSSAAFPEAEVLVAAITEAGLTVTHEHRRIGGLVTVIAGVLM